ncbi:MAG: DUF6036 family nucleotidyltransferase [Nanoarchaeota archaeon]
MIVKQDLLKWIRNADRRLERSITLVAVGGTAMTLLGLKPSTIDVDLCITSKDKKDFEKSIGNNFKVDLFVDGFIFSEQLPSDYIQKSKDILQLKNIMLKALSPLDIIITKAARLNARDEEEISLLARYVNKEELIERFKEVVGTYVGNANIYRHNFEFVVRRFFK